MSIRIARALGSCYRSFQTQIAGRFSTVPTRLCSKISQKSQQIMKMFTRSFEQKGSSSIPRFFAVGLAGCAASLFVFNTLYAEEKPAAPDDAGQLMVEYSQNPYGCPAFHYALLMGRPDVAKFILEFEPRQAFAVTPPLSVMHSHYGYKADQNGFKDFDNVVDHKSSVSAMELAVRYGDRELVKKLLDLGVDPNIVGREWAPKQEGSWESSGVRLVYDINKDPRLCHVNGVNVEPTFEWHSRSILYLAMQKNDPELVDLLLERGANFSNCYTVHRREPYYDTGVDKVKDLIQKGYLLLPPEYNYLYANVARGESALEVAAKMVSDQMLRKLLSHQAKSMGLSVVTDDAVEACRGLVLNPLGLPPLHYAAAKKDRAAFKLLLAHGFDPADQGSAPQPLLKTLAGKNPFMMALIEKRENYKYRALSAAIESNNIKLVKQILKKHPEEAGNALSEAVRGNNTEITKVILSDKKLKIQGCEQVLESAIILANDDIVHMLVDHGFTHPNSLYLAIEKRRESIYPILAGKEMINDEALRAAVIRKDSKALGLIHGNYTPSAHGLAEAKRLATVFQSADSFDILSRMSSHQ